MPDRLVQQMNFIIEIDKLKTVYRRAYLASDPTRRENSAEHSWHMTMMALLLSETAPEKLDVFKVVKMAMVHDIVEVDAGDTSIYDQEGLLDKTDREKRAARRIFALLPADQHQELLGIWEEFEKGATPEAKFARALDRLMPLVLNYCTHGKRWKEDGITYEQVFAVNQLIRDTAPHLWQMVSNLIEESVSKGYLKKRQSKP
jgi:putative hydrolases of HD superfamily